MKTGISTHILENVHTSMNEVKKGKKLTVTGVVKLTEAWSIYDTIQFYPGGVLEVPAKDVTEVVVAMKKLVLTGPDHEGMIRFYDDEPINGINGRTPPSRLPRKGRSRSHGRDGKRGTHGENGTPGGVFDLPSMYVVIDGVFSADTGETLTNIKNFVVEGVGVKGGNGGRGGNAQHGQSGQHGRHGRADTLKICKKSAGNGGDGGDGGNAGRGGEGANGGKGCDVYFLVTPSTVKPAESIKVFNKGGKPGIGGAHGKAGLPGDKGDGGSGPGTCFPGRHGRSGSKGKPAKGKRARDGQKVGAPGFTVISPERPE